MEKKIIINIENLKDTDNLAGFLLKKIKPPVIICLYGEIGIGKTQFVKFFAKRLGIKKIVNSSTFNKMKIYENNQKRKLIHLDGYHLDENSDFSFYKDYLTEDYVIIEWPELFIKNLKNMQKINLFFKYKNKNKREIKIQTESKILEKLK